MAETHENCLPPLCTPGGASVKETKEVGDMAKKDLLKLRAEMNSFNGFSFEYLNIPLKNIEAFKKTLTFILSEYKKSGFSYEKGNTFYVGKDIIAEVAPIMGKNDIKLNIDGKIDPIWMTEELSQNILSKNNAPISKKQSQDLCDFLNTLIKVQ